jgi:hypothetical protein
MISFVALFIDMAEHHISTAFQWSLSIVLMGGVTTLHSVYVLSLPP